MSGEIDQASARLLETSFRQVFSAAPAFRDVIADQKLFLFTQNSDLPAEPDAITLPCLIFAARVTGDFRKIKHNGQWADMCELTIEARVDGTYENSSDQVEQLYTDVRAVVEKGAAGILGWFYLNWYAPSEETGFENGARFKRAVYPMPCMSLATAGMA